MGRLRRLASFRLLSRASACRRRWSASRKPTNNCLDDASGVSTAVFFKRIPAAQLAKSDVMIFLATLVRIAFLSTLLGVVAGCSTVGSLGDSVGGFLSHRDPNAEALNLGAVPRQVAGQPATNPSDKPKVLPVASQDINCPEVEIADNGAALRVGGPDNASVRYQFNISDTARECDPAGP